MSPISVPPLRYATVAALAAAALLSIPAVGAVPAADAATAKPRLISGPQVYRLKPTGEKFGFREVTSYRYAIVFRLSRVTIGPTFEGDEGGDIQAGEFTLGGVELPSYTHSHLYSRKYRPQHCVVAYFDQDEGSKRDRRKLDRVKVGAKVAVTLRPLASDNPNVSYGRTYHRKAVMRQTSKYSLTDAGVQRQLRAIGCQRRG